MNNIGQRIRELRKKNDLTQEVLADFLGVTYKAVSKWECGLSMPDLSLIGPLTRILKVSADELLGLTPVAMDLRRAELEENLRQAWINGGELDGFYLVYKAEEIIVREYPDDMKALCNFAWTTSNRALHSENKEEDMLKAIHRFETVIENTNDQNIKLDAIRGIVRSFSYIGLYDEAKKYAELVPETPNVTKENILEDCLRGDELRKYRQQRLKRTVHGLLTRMYQCSEDKVLAVEDCEKILQIIIPDGEYFEFYFNLVDLSFRKSITLVKFKKYNEAINELRKYKEYSIQCDRCDNHKEEFRYTSMYFDLLALPSNIPTEKVQPSYSETFKINIMDDIFSPLHDRDDFKELLK